MPRVNNFCSCSAGPACVLYTCSLWRASYQSSWEAVIQHHPTPLASRDLFLKVTWVICES